jgi:hypothetical protein
MRTIRPNEIIAEAHQPERDAPATAWWHCPTCGKTLGKVIGDEVYIRHGRNHHARPLPARRRCTGCDTISTYPPEAIDRKGWQAAIVCSPRTLDFEPPADQDT